MRLAWSKSLFNNGVFRLRESQFAIKKSVKTLWGLFSRKELYMEFLQSWTLLFVNDVFYTSLKYTGRFEYYFIDDSME